MGPKDVLTPSEIAFNEIPSTSIFTALGTEFLIPGTEVVHRKVVSKPKGPSSFKWSIMKETFVTFWSNVRTRIWILFVDALWIPAYRPEWGKYKTWQYSYGSGKKKKGKRFSNNDSDSTTKSIEGTLSVKKFNRKKTIESILSRRPSVAPTGSLCFQPHDSGGCKIIRINVTGLIFETQCRSLEQFPDTLLGNVVRRNRYWDPLRHEYFFDRHRKSFESILHYYQSGGKLYRSPEVPLNIFIDEIKFYDLGKKELIKFLREEEVMYREDLPKPMPVGLLQRKIWFLSEYPESSKQAQFIAIFSVFVVILSTAIFTVESIPVFSQISEMKQSRFKDPFFLCESVCAAWFTLELVIRLVASPQKIEFMKGLMNIVDVISILPFYFTIATIMHLDFNTKDSNSFESSNTLITLRIFRLFRVFRVFKLSRHSAGLQVLGKTLKASLRELWLLIFVLILCVIIFSSIIYFAEMSEENSDFDSIPDAFWWGIVTLTSLGYGDKVPRGPLGKIVGSLCAVAAVLTLALPIPVFVANFNYFYQQEGTQEERRLDSNPSKHVQECSYLSECPVLMRESMEQEKRKREAKAAGSGEAGVGIATTQAKQGNQNQKNLPKQNILSLAKGRLEKPGKGKASSRTPSSTSSVASSRGSKKGAKRGGPKPGLGK